MVALHNSHYNGFPMKIKFSCIKNKQQEKSTTILHNLIAIKPIQLPFSTKPREEVTIFVRGGGLAAGFYCNFIQMRRKSIFEISNIENTYVRTTTLTCIRMPSILMPVKKENSQQPSQNPKNGQQRVYVATKTKKRKIVKSTN